jgi:hypothetical protein
MKLMTPKYKDPARSIDATNDARSHMNLVSNKCAPRLEAGVPLSDWNLTDPSIGYRSIRMIELANPEAKCTQVQVKPYFLIVHKVHKHNVHRCSYVYRGSEAMRCKIPND